MPRYRKCDLCSRLVENTRNLCLYCQYRAKAQARRDHAYQQSEAEAAATDKMLAGIRNLPWRYLDRSAELRCASVLIRVRYTDQAGWNWSVWALMDMEPLRFSRKPSRYRATAQVHAVYAAKELTGARGDYGFRTLMRNEESELSQEDK